MRVFTVLFLFFLHFNFWAAQHGAVATVDPIATDAAIAAMKQGGNAIDAAVATAAALNLVEPNMSGIGGVGYFHFEEVTLTLHLGKRLFITFSTGGREA